MTFTIFRLPAYLEGTTSWNSKQAVLSGRYAEREYSHCLQENATYQSICQQCTVAMCSSDVASAWVLPFKGRLNKS